MVGMVVFDAKNLLGAKEVIFQTHLYNIIYMYILCTHYLCLLIFLFDIHLHNTVRYSTHASFRKTMMSYEEVDGAGGPKVIKLVHKHENSQSLLPTDGFAILLNRTTELFPKKTKPETDSCLTTSRAFCLRNSWYYPPKMQLLVIKPGQFCVPG